MAKNINYIIGLILIFSLCGFNLYGHDQSCIVDCALKEVGVRELTGANDGAEVEKYLATTGLGAGYPWCAAFVNYIFQKCGYTGPRFAARAAAWFPDSRLLYTRGAGDFRAEPGDVGALYYAHLGRIGHVFIVEEIHTNTVITIEGNTNEAGSREGDGVYRKRRMKRAISHTARWRL